nr:MAG TPA: hypothetical protein [Caudoviricetes sp.]
MEKRKFILPLFLFFQCLEKLKELRDSFFILMVAPYSPVSLFFCQNRFKTPQIYTFLKV